MDHISSQAILECVACRGSERIEARARGNEARARGNEARARGNQKQRKGHT